MKSNAFGKNLRQGDYRNDGILKTGIDLSGGVFLWQRIKFDYRTPEPDETMVMSQDPSTKQRIEGDATNGRTYTRNGGTDLFTDDGREKSAIRRRENDQ